MITDTEDSDLDDRYSVMHPIIYPEDSDKKYFPIKLPYAEPTPEPTTPSEKTTEGPTSEPNYDALSEPSAPTSECSVSPLAPKYIVRYQKGSDPPKFSTPEECIN